MGDVYSGKRLTGIFLIWSVLINGALAYFGRGSFSHTLFAIGFVVCIALPVFAIWFVVFVVLQTIKEAWPFHRVLLGCAVLAASTVISVPFGNALNHHDIEQAKKYCELLVPRIEDHRVHHGKYPQRLALLGDIPEPPYLLKENPSACYFADDLRYGFTFSDPAEMMGGWHYDSETRQWKTWD